MIISMQWLMRDERRRWAALAVVCLGQLMMILDATIVNVALPAIQADLHFSQSGLTWILDAYMIAFGSFLLLAGRLGDLIGRKRIFLIGLVMFTAASAACGFADSQNTLIAARFLQGLGGAVASAVILAIIVTDFREPRERATAMSVYTFIVSSGGSIGLLAGGSLTEALGWHWIFFINLPIGALAFFLGRILIEESPALGLRRGVDWMGAVLVTGATMLIVYAIVKAAEYGWGSAHTLGFAGARRRAAGRVRRAGDAAAPAAVPAPHPAGARPHGQQRRARVPDHRDVLHLRARVAVPGARARLRRAADRARVPAR